MKLREENISNMANSEELTKTEKKIESADHAKSEESPQECVAENEKVGSLNTGNRDVGSDNVRHTVDTRYVIARTKPHLLS